MNISKITPNRIAINGRMNSKNAEISCLTVDERFISIANHIMRLI